MGAGLMSMGGLIGLVEHTLVDVCDECNLWYDILKKLAQKRFQACSIASKAVLKKPTMLKFLMDKF